MNRAEVKQYLRRYKRACSDYERVKYNLYAVNNDLYGLQVTKYDKIPVQGGNGVKDRLEGLMDKSEKLSKQLNELGEKKDAIKEEIEQFIRVLNNPDWENILFDFYIKDMTYTEIEKKGGYAWGVPKNITSLACVRLAQIWTARKLIAEVKEETHL